VLLRLFLIFFSIPLHATVFQMQPVEQQVKEADGIVVGHFLRKKYVKLDGGGTATQMIFKIKQESGMQSDLFGMDEIIIHYPGGKLGEEVVKVEGVPEFVVGENVVVMIKSYKDRYWGMNLGFGTFKVVNYGNNRMIINTLFPEDRRVGQMKYDDFEKTVKAIRGSSLKIVTSQINPSEMDNGLLNRVPASVPEGKNRAIASQSEEVENNISHGVNTLWLVFILAMMGGIFRFLRQKEAN
jgi:hypothetical protein